VAARTASSSSGTGQVPRTSGRCASPRRCRCCPAARGFLELLAVGDDLIVLADLGDGGHDPDPRLPRLTDLAEQVVTAATAAWGPQPLALAPAFRPR
jgi:hypothetical protein